MEIYRLKDEVCEGRDEEGQDFDRDSVNGELKITELKSGVKNPERVNVYVNGKYALSLDVAQVVDYKVKVGRVLNEDELAELQRESEFGKLYQRTLEWVLMRPRSVRETRDYLFRKKIKKSSSDTLAPTRRYGGRFANSLPVGREMSSEDFSDFFETIIERLISKGYLDDKKFAEFWVENRFLKKGVSQKRLKMELLKKGVAKEIIEEVLGGRDDDAEIEKMIAKKRGKYTDEKLIQYLCRQGFSYDLVKEKLAELGGDCERVEFGDDYGE